MLLAEQHDAWQVGRNYVSAESLAKGGDPAPTPALMLSREGHAMLRTHVTGH